MGSEGLASSLLRVFACRGVTRENELGQNVSAVILGARWFCLYA